MTKQTYSVRFLKGTDDLADEGKLNAGTQGQLWGGAYTDVPLAFRLADGSTKEGTAYLQIGNRRFCFWKGSVGGAWTNPKDRDAYMKMINGAVGETICVPAEQGELAGAA